jgi:hypothetical protein
LRSKHRHLTGKLFRWWLAGSAALGWIFVGFGWAAHIVSFAWLHRSQRSKARRAAMENAVG